MYGSFFQIFYADLSTAFNFLIGCRLVLNIMLL